MMSFIVDLAYIGVDEFSLKKMIMSDYVRRQVIIR